MKLESAVIRVERREQGPNGLSSGCMADMTRDSAIQWRHDSCLKVED